MARLQPPEPTGVVQSAIDAGRSLGGAGREILPLTSLRAVAAWWVVLYHFNEVLPFRPVVRSVIREGFLAVDLFFVMSGYILAMQYGRVFAGGFGRQAYGWFVGVRLARVYPLHLVVLLLFVSIPVSDWLTGRPIDAFFDPASLVQSLFLVQDWGFSTPLHWNGPAWSISAEFFFYLLFPLLAFALARPFRSWIGLFAVPVLVLLAIGANEWMTANWISQWGFAGLFRCLTECVLGMWLAQVSRHPALGRAASLGLIAAAAVLFGLYAAGHGAGGLLVIVPGYVCLVWGLLNPDHVVSRALSYPVLLWLGRVSFSTYMIHYFVRDWLRFLVIGQLPPGVVFVMYVALVAAASAALHHGVEVPGRRAGRRLADKLFAPQQQRRQSAATAV